MHPSLAIRFVITDPDKHPEDMTRPVARRRSLPADHELIVGQN
jgi:hypothetical protein